MLAGGGGGRKGNQTVSKAPGADLLFLVLFLSKCATSQSGRLCSSLHWSYFPPPTDTNTHTQTSTAAAVASTLPHIEPIKYANFGKGSESVYSRSFSGELSAVCVRAAAAVSAALVIRQVAIHFILLLSFPFLFFFLCFILSSD